MAWAGNYGSGAPARVYDNTAPGGGKINLSKLDPRKVTVDDFRDRIEQEEERLRNRSSGQGSSRNLVRIVPHSKKEQESDVVSRYSP
ncbi:Pre-mRNA-splicing factor SLU7, partial [Frankliniella fusca]